MHLIYNTASNFKETKARWERYKNVVGTHYRAAIEGVGDDGSVGGSPTQAPALLGPAP